MTYSRGGEVGQVVTLDGKRCLEGRVFSFDVDDRYAFDIDETVRLVVEFYKHSGVAVAELSYEKNGEAEVTLREQIPGYKRAHAVTRQSSLSNGHGLPIADSS